VSVHAQEGDWFLVPGRSDRVSTDPRPPGHPPPCAAKLEQPAEFHPAPRLRPRPPVCQRFGRRADKSGRRLGLGKVPWPFWVLSARNTVQINGDFMELGRVFHAGHFFRTLKASLLRCVSLGALPSSWSSLSFFWPKRPANLLGFLSCDAFAALSVPTSVS
jgi:hypothetical protein